MSDFLDKVRCFGDQTKSTTIIARDANADMDNGCIVMEDPADTNKVKGVIPWDGTSRLLGYIKHCEAGVKAGECASIQVDELVENEQPELMLNMNALESVIFDPSDCSIVATTMSGAVSRTPVLNIGTGFSVTDPTNQALGFVGFNADGKLVPARLPEMMDPPVINCFYEMGDKSKSNAINCICDAIDNGKALAMRINGRVEEIFDPATEDEIVEFLESNDAQNIDVDNWTWTVLDKVEICKEQFTCALANATNLVNNLRDVDTTTGVSVLHRDILPFELTTSVTDPVTGNAKFIVAASSFTSTAETLVEVSPPVITDRTPSTISTGTSCCPVVCEPELINYEYRIVDIDRDATFEILSGNPTVVTTGTTGEWTIDPNDPNIHIFDAQETANPNAQIRFTLQPGESMSGILTGGDFLGQQFFQNVRRAVLLRYVCDSSLNSNRLDAFLPGDISINQNAVEVVGD